MWVLVFKMSLAAFLFLTPAEQSGLVDAVAKVNAEYFQCQDYEVAVIAYKDKALFFLKCEVRFGGGEMEKVCFYQICKAKVVHIKEGCGDCSKCTASPENKNCSDYIPLTLWTFNAVDAKPPPK